MEKENLTKACSIMNKKVKTIYRIPVQTDYGIIDYQVYSSGNKYYIKWNNWWKNVTDRQELFITL